jgi:hypothetical protein
VADPEIARQVDREIALLKAELAAEASSTVRKADLEAEASNTVRTRAAIPRSVKREVWVRDGGRCRKCGITDAEAMVRDGEHLHLDHMHPWSQDGADTPDNLQLLCGPCNRAKGDRPGPLAVPLPGTVKPSAPSAQLRQRARELIERQRLERPGWLAQEQERWRELMRRQQRDPLAPPVRRRGPLPPVVPSPDPEPKRLPPLRDDDTWFCD